MTHTNVNICMFAETLTANILLRFVAWTPLNTVGELEQQQGRLILQLKTIEYLNKQHHHSIGLTPPLHTLNERFTRKTRNNTGGEKS